MPFVVIVGTSHLWCGTCKKPTEVIVSSDRGGLRIKSRGAT